MYNLISRCINSCSVVVKVTKVQGQNRQFSSLEKKNTRQKMSEEEKKNKFIFTTPRWVYHAKVITTFTKRDYWKGKKKHEPDFKSIKNATSDTHKRTWIHEKL